MLYRGGCSATQIVQCDARSFFLCKWALAGGGGRSLYTTYCWPPGRSFFTRVLVVLVVILYSITVVQVGSLEVILYHAAAVSTNVHLEGHSVSVHSIDVILPSLSTVYSGSSVTIFSLLL